LEVVKYLVEKGANIHTEYDRALISASGNGHVEVVKYLVEKGADPKNDEALARADENGHLKVVKYLTEFEKGANT
jgi:ankyrin repeat protein